MRVRAELYEGVEVSFDLAREAAMRFSLGAVLDISAFPQTWTSYRLKTHTFLLETESQRFELAMDGVGPDGFDTYRLSRVRDATALPVAAMRDLGLPLPHSVLEPVAWGLDWSQLRWREDGLRLLPPSSATSSSPSTSLSSSSSWATSAYCATALPAPEAMLHLAAGSARAPPDSCKLRGSGSAGVWGAVSPSLASMVSASSPPESGLGSAACRVVAMSSQGAVHLFLGAQPHHCLGLARGSACGYLPLRWRTASSAPHSRARRGGAGQPPTPKGGQLPAWAVAIRGSVPSGAVLDLGFDVDAELRPQEPAATARSSSSSAAATTEKLGEEEEDEDEADEDEEEEEEANHDGRVAGWVREERLAKRACEAAERGGGAAAGTAVSGWWAAAAATAHLEAARIARAKAEAARLQVLAEAEAAALRSPRARASKKRTGAVAGEVEAAMAEASKASEEHTAKAMHLDARLMGKPVVEGNGALFLPLTTIRLLENCPPLKVARNAGAAAAAAEAMRQELDSALQAYQNRNPHAIKA